MTLFEALFLVLAKMIIASGNKKVKMLLQTLNMF